MSGVLHVAARRFAVPAAWAGLLHVAIGALLIVAAVAANRAPTVFTDSDDYYELGRQIVARADAALHPAPPAEPLSAEEAADAAQAVDDLHMGHTQMASRSAAYALFLYPLERAGTLWLVTLVQALGVAWLVRALWRAAVPAAPPGHYLLGMAALSAATALPIFAGFAMPDIFAAVAVLAVVLLGVFWDGTRPAVRWAIGAVLAFALAVHTSHLLLAVATLPLVALTGGRRPVAAIAAAVVIAWGVNAAYVRIDEAATGEPLRRQPFLVARMLADGPGRDFLRRDCADGARWTLCRFAREPLDDSEDILWSDLPATGVFLTSDYATRIAIEDEEARFVAAVIAADPLGVAGAALRNWGRQLAAYRVEEPLRDPHYYLTDDYWGDTFLPEMIRGAADCGPASDRCASRLTPHRSGLWHGAVLAVAAIVVAGLSWRRRRAGGDRRLDLAVGVLLAGIVLNAAVCGILSGPFARYEARLVWLLPLAALLLVSYSVSSAVKKPVISA